MHHSISVATPAEPRGEKIFYFKILGGEKLLESAGELFSQEPLNAPFLNGLFSSGFSRGKTAPQDEIDETPH